MTWWRSAPVRLFGTMAAIAGGAALGWPGWAWAGALGAYMLTHSVGWVLEARPTALRRATPPPHAQKYHMRTTTLSGSVVAGLGFGLLGMISLAGTFALIGNAVSRRIAAGAPLVFVTAIAAVVVGGVFWLRRVVLSDVEVVVGTETLVLRVKRRKDPWQELRVPLSNITSVTRFADPFGPGRWLRVDAGEAGRFELRACGILAGRRARAAVARLGADLIARLGVETCTRPYLARWGTFRYVAQRGARLTAGKNYLP